MITLEQSGISEELNEELLPGIVVNKIFIQSPFQAETRHVIFQVKVYPSILKIDSEQILNKKRKFVKIEQADDHINLIVKISIKSPLTTNVTYIEMISDFLFKFLPT